MKQAYTYFLFLIVAHIITLLVIANYHAIFPFQTENYTINSHHYIQDARVVNGSFNLTNALGQYDAQWYLKVAQEGYPNHPKITNINNKSVMDGLTYAFFPLYPLLIKIVNVFFKNVEQSAFIFSNALLLIDFVNLTYVLSKFFPKKTVLKSVMLLFFFPFSIVYRSYFTEGVYLFLLIWFAYFWMKKKYIPASLSLALINITKANGFLLNVFYFVDLFKLFKKKKLTGKNFLFYSVILLAPFILWMEYCYQQTGNPVYFVSVRREWSLMHGIFLFYPIVNLMTILNYPMLPFHFFHYSQIDVLTVLCLLVLLIKSKRYLSSKLWYISLALWLSPLLVTDLMSFTRYQVVSFPMFLYLASVLSGWKFFFILCLFYILLLITSLFFVNWYWIG